jgi:hypothetical protein
MRGAAGTGLGGLCNCAPSHRRCVTRPCIRTVPLSDITITLVRTVAELEQWFPLADLQLETLTRCRHLERDLAGV